MQSVQKLKYNPYFVRPEFRRVVCKELILPGNKPSGKFFFPVEEDFVQRVAGEYEFPGDEVLESCGAKNVHEWLLWASARIKYGVNYLNPRKEQFWLPDSAYEPDPEPDLFEDDRIELHNLIEQRIEWVAETLVNQGLDETAKKAKNILREHLTSENDEV